MTKLSRSKIDLFLKCPRCFWLDMKNVAKRPQLLPYTINLAVDKLLKLEFDVYREKQKAPPVMKKYKINAIPYKTEFIDAWRENFTGIRYEHKPTDFLITGAIDDVWVNPQGELIVVDYKSTGAKGYKIYDEYKRQMEVYQWLFRQNGYKVSNTGYFLFAKVNKEKGFKEAKLSFDLFIEMQDGDSSWVENTIISARKCLDGSIPESGDSCEHCQFAEKSSREK